MPLIPHVPLADGSSCCLRLFWLVLLTFPLCVIGPRPSACPRDRSDLELGRVTHQTATLRVQLLEDLAGWIQTVQPDLPGLSQLARNQPVILSELVEEFGRTLYEQGASRRTFAETVNALQQKFAFLKTWLHGSWALLTTWESLWPGQDHPPMPLMLLKAMVSTALAWGWKRVSLLLLVGFYGLLRPVEACLMKVTDFMTPADTGVPDILILQLHHVKSRTRGAKFQSVRLEEPHVITFIKKCFASMSQDERLWPFSVNLFRTRFQQVLQATCHTPKLVFPSSLRPGGATYLFQVWGENLPKLQWRGRWIHVKTLTHYIQELGTINVLSQLTPPQKAKVRQLAELCEGALQDFKPCLDTQTLLHVAAKGLSQT